ncbi:hypothetical protein [Pinisolibacter sp.]|uniref:hypothetical protein n=1 Tax=Pinisolibacter sp. TaxID=2172024 RepID=UPI002FDE265F
MNRFLVFGAIALLPTTAVAMPFFNHFYNESGYTLDVRNSEDRAYQCRTKYDLEYMEDGKIRAQHIDQTLTVPAKWSGRLVSFPSTTRSVLRTYRYDIVCD